MYSNQTVLGEEEEGEEEEEEEEEEEKPDTQTSVPLLVYINNLTNQHGMRLEEDER